MSVSVDRYEQALVDRAAGWPDYTCWRQLTADVLRRVAAREGIDFATALVYDRIVRSADHGPFIERVRAAAESDDTACLDGIMAIVPGAGYVEYPDTGADGRRLRDVAQRLGWRTDLVPVASFGSVRQNAEQITTWLTKPRDDPVLLVSLSKGGADVRAALARPDAPHAFRHVAAWVNLSGIVFGTSLAGWFLNNWFRRLLARWLMWYRGYDFSVLRELDRMPCGALAGDFELPCRLKVIHVVGFPLTVHLSSRRARRGHRRLAPLGPNDGGGILLGDVCRLPGLIFPVWGADHYMQPAWEVRPLIRRILRVALDMQEAEFAASGAFVA